MDFEVIIPWFPAIATPARTRALRYVRSRYLAAGFAVTAAVCPCDRFCKAAAVIPALERSRASVVAVADADVWAEGDAVELGRQAVLAGKHWVRPYTNVLRLTEEGTTEYFLSNGKSQVEQKQYIGIAGGGIVIAKRDTLLDVPLDKRFIGWGGEDESWGIALGTLVGPVHFLGNDLIHFWHEKPERLTRQVGNQENEKLRRKYYGAIAKPDRMRKIIEDAKQSQIQL